MPCPYEALRLREFEEIDDLKSVEKGRSMAGKNARPPPDYMYYLGGPTFLSGCIMRDRNVPPTIVRAFLPASVASGARFSFAYFSFAYFSFAYFSFLTKEKAIGATGFEPATT